MYTASSVYDNDAVRVCVCQTWFTKFHPGVFNINNAPHYGRPTDSGDVKAIVDANTSQAVRKIAIALNTFHISVGNHLRQLIYVSHLNFWVLHKLTKANLLNRISNYDCWNVKRTSIVLKKMLTADEKWIVYDNLVLKRLWGQRYEPSQTTSKAVVYFKKILLSEGSMTGFQGFALLRVVTSRPNNWVNCILFAVK